jgi:hypothetical protein
MRRVYKALGSFIVLLAVLMPLQRSLEREAWVIFLAVALSYAAWLTGNENAHSADTPTGERRGSSGFVVLLSLAGLASGVFTAALVAGGGYNLDNLFDLSEVGIPFAAIMAVCFATTGVARNTLKVPCFFILATCTLPFTVFIAMGLEVGAATHSISTHEIVHPIALFAGGMLGGFIILSGALLLQFKMSFGDIAYDAFRWSALVGVLSPVAWALGPSLGIWIWSALHAVGLATPTDTLQNALYGGTGNGPPSRFFALFVLWQTGMGFALGMTLRNMRHIRQKSPSEELKLT